MPHLVDCAAALPKQLCHRQLPVFAVALQPASSACFSVVNAMKKGSLLLVDDDRHVLESMADWLREQGYKVDVAADRASALAAVDRKPFDLVLADIRLPRRRRFRRAGPLPAASSGTSVILITGYGTVETAVEAIRAGAFDFLTKPLIDEELQMAIQRALNQREVLEENENLKAQLDLRFGMENIVGHDQRMLRIFDMVDSIADTRATVLITGESGTGKSLVARAIHRRSPRATSRSWKSPAGRCPRTLLESELFGHVAGSFTGATGDKLGKFMQADGGTIFLDEIGTASPGMQVKLLRVLQEFEFEQVGGTKTFHVDARVILATNEDLTQAVAAGRFRQDLYYRVNVINIELPPLRERLSDIPLLAKHFLDGSARSPARSASASREEAADGHAALSLAGQRPRIAERHRTGRAARQGRPRRARRSAVGLAGVGAAGHRPIVAGKSLKQALAIPERQIILEVLDGTIGTATPRPNRWGSTARRSIRK